MIRAMNVCGLCGGSLPPTPITCNTCKVEGREGDKGLPCPGREGDKGLPCPGREYPRWCSVSCCVVHMKVCHAERAIGTLGVSEGRRREFSILSRGVKPCWSCRVEAATCANIPCGHTILCEACRVKGSGEAPPTCLACSQAVTGVLVLRP